MTMLSHNHPLLPHTSLLHEDGLLSPFDVLRSLPNESPHFAT